MKIALLGSTGFLGKILLERALDQGIQIKTLVRDADKLGPYKDRVDFIQGNMFNAHDIEKTLQDTKAVVSTFGPPQRNPGDPRQYEKAMQDLVSAMHKHHIKRLIHVGGAVHPGGENEKWPLKRRFLRFMLNLVGKPILEAKHLEWQVLKHSDLDWTLVRPPRIVRGESKGKKLVADEKYLATLQVNANDLSDFILEQLDSDYWVAKAPLVASK